MHFVVNLEISRKTFFSFFLQKLQARISTDEDLKLSDTLRYYMNDSAAAKNLLYRRSRALADYENSNKTLEKARNKNKDVRQAEDAQDRAYHRFTDITDSAKEGAFLLHFSRIKKYFTKCSSLTYKQANRTLPREGYLLKKKMRIRSHNNLALTHPD